MRALCQSWLSNPATREYFPTRQTRKLPNFGFVFCAGLGLIHMVFGRRKTPAGSTHDATAPLYDHLNLDPKLLVSFTTDTEGNWEYFRRFVERAEGLEWKGMGPSGYAADIELKDGWRFIFGGDAVDKGNVVGGSIRVVNSLLALKRRYPDRVTLLLGNRDLNKMRLTSELAPSELAPELLPMLDGPR